jgi:dTDP-4-dehydrorhamnose 3,5-epimerase
MKILKTDFEGLFIIEPNIFSDKRGCFFESYSEKAFRENGIIYNWIQDNQSESCYGTIRGLHFQKGEWAQAKLVRCVYGKVLDVAVDIREGSPTYGKYFSIELSGENKKIALIPRGFAHGFSTLSDYAIFQYKCDNFYNKESEGGILYNDKTLNINWKVEYPIVSEKDKLNMSFNDYDLFSRHII